MSGAGNIVKSIVPIAATALGAYFLGPAIGGVIGTGAAASAAGTAIGGAVGGLAGQAVAGGASAPQVDVNIPAPAAPTAAPAPMDQSIVDSQKKSITSQIARRGRAASILTAGGTDGTSSKLGG